MGAVAVALWTRSPAHSIFSNHGNINLRLAATSIFFLFFLRFFHRTVFLKCVLVSPVGLAFPRQMRWHLYTTSFTPTVPGGTRYHYPFISWPPRWSARGMREKPPAPLFRVGNVNGELAWWNVAFGFGFRWWWWSLLHVRLVNHICIFGADYDNVIRALLDKLVENLPAVGPQLNYSWKLDMPPGNGRTIAPKKLYFSTRDLALVMGKYDHSMPVGLHHRRVRCILQLCVRKKKTKKENTHFM